MNMSNPVLTPFVSSKQMLSSGLGTWQRLATFYARFALGAAFLSAVAARFGLWGENTGPDSFKHFIEYTGEVNSFMPAFMVPFLAWAATITETLLRHSLSFRDLAPLRGSGCGRAAGFVWHRHGHFVRHQIAAGLFRVFRIRRRVAVINLPEST
jgi:hypothetical protein